MTRFSSSELYELRNKISLLSLIKFLRIETQQDGEVLIFSCPSCAGYRTGVNPQANLCRCFYCERNFNPIELVMESKKFSFVESVKLLKLHFAALIHLPDSVNARDSQQKSSDPGTSSVGGLSSLERHLVALATPKRSQSLLGKNV